MAGRLLFVLTADEFGPGELVVANAGAGLDAAGVESLSTLRASAKRSGHAVGRFGVGFASVLAVSDEPAVLSCAAGGAGTGVRWSAAATRELVGAIPALAGEAARRDGSVPVLRLPFAAAGTVPAGYDTAVRLPLRSAAAERVTRELLAEIDPTLLLVLPGLAEVVVVVDGDVRRLTARREGSRVELTDGAGCSRWRLRSAAGRLPATVPADRPTEERERTDWSLTWAVPVDDGNCAVPLPAGLPAVVRAPTPSDEPLSLPALLVASLPLEPSRRHVAPGPLRDWLVEQAGTAYADLLADLAPTPALLRLVPTGLAHAELDARLHASALAALRSSALLPAAEDPGLRLRPGDALTLDLGTAADALVPLLVDAVPGLLPAGWHDRRAAAALGALGVRRWSVGELVDILTQLRRPPEWWNTVYAALHDVEDREALAGLPVPLADGSVVVGARGTLVGARDVPVGAASALGLRVVDPAAAHPLLLRLGAVEATPRSLLEDPRVRAAVEASYDEEDPGPVADAVLALVGAAGVAPGELGWLAELALPTDDGDWRPAGELLLPGGALAQLVDEDAPFGVLDGDLAERVGAEVLRAVGVLDGFAVLREEAVLLDPAAAEHDLDDEDRWFDAVLDAVGDSGELPPMLVELVAVRDLELVRADAWPAALGLLSSSSLRAAVTAPAAVQLADGQLARAPSYAGWWLSTHPVLGGELPARLRMSDAEPALAGLFDPAPGQYDEEFLRAIGVRASLAEVLADESSALDVLARLADPARSVDRSALRRIYAALPEAFAGSDLRGLPWPDRLRAVRAGQADVVDVVDVITLDRPDLLPLLSTRAVLPVPLPLAEQVGYLLNVQLASRAAAYDVVSTPGRSTAWPDIDGVALAVQRLGAAAPPTAVVVVHADLTVTDIDGVPVSVPWWSEGGTDHVHAGAGAGGLGRALAWRLGAWAGRQAAVEALTGVSPDETARLAAEDDLG